MTQSAARERIRAFLSRSFPDHDLRDDEDIFALGFVNSLFAMQLVLFVEKEFAVTVDSQDLDLDNFRSVDALVSMVESKTAGRKS